MNYQLTDETNTMNDLIDDYFHQWDLTHSKYEELSILENIVLYLEDIHKLSKTTAIRITKKALKNFGISEDYNINS